MDFRGGWVWKITFLSQKSGQDLKNLSVRKKKKRMLSYESKFSRHMRNMGNAAEYFMFLSGKVGLWSVYIFFIKKFLAQK